MEAELAVAPQPRGILVGERAEPQRLRATEQLAERLASATASGVPQRWSASASGRFEVKTL